MQQDAHSSGWNAATPWVPVHRAGVRSAREFVVFAGGPDERKRKGNQAMRTHTMRFGLALAVAGMLCFIAQPAWAGHHGGINLGGVGKALAGAAKHHGGGSFKGIGKALSGAAGHRGKIDLPNLSRAIRGGGHSQNLGNALGQALRSSGGHGRSQNLGNLLGQGLRNSGGRNQFEGLGGLLGQGLLNGNTRHGGSGNLGGLLNEGLRNGYIGNGQILQSLIGGGYGNGYGYGGYGHGYGGYGGYGYDDYGMPQAYRDVGIANAVVGLVGVAAQAAQNSQYYRYGQPAAQYYNQRVLVSPAHYETKQVWIPETFDPQTGAKTGGGFYETRTELVPEVYEDRMVPAPVTYAPAPAPVAVPVPVPVPVGGLMAPPMPPVTMHGPMSYRIR